MDDTDNEFLDELRVGFLQEASDLIATLEASFLELEKNPANEKELEKVLRLFHNLKGSAAAVDFKDLSAFCHRVENLLVKIKAGEASANSVTIELLLKCTDRVLAGIGELGKNRQASLDFSDLVARVEAAMSAAHQAVELPAALEKLAELVVFADLSNAESLKAVVAQLKLILGCSIPEERKKTGQAAAAQLSGFLASELGEDAAGAGLALCQQFLSQAPAAEPGAAAAGAGGIDEKLFAEFLADAGDEIEAIESGLLILEKKQPESEQSPEWPEWKEALDSVFRGFHTLKSASAIVRFNELETLTHALESALDEVRARKVAFSGQLASLCLEATALARRWLASAREGKRGEDPAFNQGAAEVISRLRALGIAVAEAEAVRPATQAEAKAVGGPPAATAAAGVVREPIKVDADRLDKLLDSIGELVIAEAMVAQSDDLRAVQAGSALFNHLDRLGKITRNLQEIGMALRMVPVRQTFKKMTRIVRDISKKMGKDVDFVMYGEDTELDRTVAEKIGDPLVHMVRNAIDHGIEKSAEDRIQAGKPATGRVELRALHKGGSIWVEVQDDGRGLDKDKLVAKAQEKGLLKPGQALSEQEAYELIFHSGFSTAEKVTDVSGRGVGMDVVRKNIQDIHGHVDIESRLGRGTLFRVRIPNTLAIIEGMVVTVGCERYVVPTQSIVRALKPVATEVIRSPATRQEMVKLHEEILPLLRLHRIYDIRGAREDVCEGIVLVVEDNNKRIGLLVDHILKQQQFVIKNLGDSMKGVPGVSGGTIMPDGLVGLILDIGLLVQSIGAGNFFSTETGPGTGPETARDGRRKGASEGGNEQRGKEAGI